MEAPLLEPDQTEQSLQTVEPEPQVCTDICNSTLLQHSLPLPGVADVSCLACASATKRFAAQPSWSGAVVQPASRGPCLDTLTKLSLLESGISARHGMQSEEVGKPQAGPASSLQAEAQPPVQLNDDDVWTQIAPVKVESKPIVRFAPVPKVRAAASTPAPPLSADSDISDMPQKSNCYDQRERRERIVQSRHGQNGSAASPCAG